MPACSLAVWLVCQIGGFTAPLFAQPPDLTSSPAETAGELQSPAEAAQTLRKNSIAKAAVMLLAVVLVLGIGLIAIVLMFGSRARRLAREPLPEISRPDRYWFLRNPKTPPEELPPPEPNASTPPEIPPTGN